MSWTAPIRFVDGDPITAAQINTLFRDNLNSTAPGIATRQGRLIVTAGKHQLAERQPVKSYRDGNVSTEAEWPVDPDNEDDLGPSVTFEHGGSFLAIYTTGIRRSAGTGGFADYGPVVEGTSRDDGPSVFECAVRSADNGYRRLGGHYLFEGIEPGLTTVTMKYGVSSSTGARGTYEQRDLLVIPF